LENGLQHTDRTVRPVLPFGKPTQAVEVTEEFVGAIDEVNDHSDSTLDFAAAHSKTVDRIKRMDPTRFARTTVLRFSVLESPAAASDRYGFVLHSFLLPRAARRGQSTGSQ
jgi:hypothetical protein